MTEHDSRPIVIDGLNVAYWRGKPPTLRLPLALMSALLQRGQATQLFFDANTPYQIAADELPIYGQLQQHTDCVTQVPSRRRADWPMLKCARVSGACIVSRDKFRDHRARYRKLIDDPTRLVSGFVEQDVLTIPSLDLRIPLPATVEAVWQALRPLLPAPADQ